jgi:glutamyl-tRNA synthetase
VTGVQTCALPIYIREADDSRLAALAAPGVAVAIERELTAQEHDLLLRSIPHLKARAKNINELSDGTLFMFRARPLDMDDKAKSLLDAPGKALLAEARDALAATSAWTAEALEASVRTVAERAGIGLGKVAQPLRAALTGRTTSPGIFDVLALIGRDESLGRLDDQIS